MSLDLALSAARTGLAHVNLQLAQTAANVANAATPGYTRKAVAAESILAGSVSAGVRSGEAARSVDAALTAEMNAARAAAGAAAARARLLEGVETAHGVTGQTVADLTGALGDAFVALRADPADALRQSGVTQAAGALAGRYNAVSGAILAARQGAQDGMVEDVAALNEALRRIADLTGRIVPLRAQGIGTAELEDGRDAAIASVAGILQIKSIERPDGGVTLITSGGLTLPLGGDADAFSLAPATLGAASYHGAGGTLPGVMLGGVDVTERLGQGSLAARAALRDRALPLAQAELDVSAASLAARFDAQGLTLFTGAAGGVPDPASPYATGGMLGFAAAIRLDPAVAADPVAVRDGTRAVTGGGAGPTAFTPNPAGGPAGFTALIDRVLQWSLGPEVSRGNPQPGFATAGLGPDGGLSSGLRGAGSLAEGAALMVATQTAARAGAEAQGKEAGDLLGVLETRFAARSGVDMDKEMAAMIALQTAYSANARVLSTVQGMYDTLLQAVR